MSSRLVQPFHLLCTAQPPCSSLCRKAPGHLMHHSSWWLHKNPRSWAGPAWGPGCLHPFATGCALPALPESSLIPWFLQQEAETLLFYPVLLAFDSHSSQFCKLLDPMSSFLHFFFLHLCDFELEPRQLLQLWELFEWLALCSIVCTAAGLCRAAAHITNSMGCV